MTLTELRYVVALDSERHFGRAADRSFVSQPTLSVALRKLEEQLGVSLFERQRGHVKPTPIGERIVEQARKVLAEAKLIEALADEGQDELKGKLRLGAIFTVAPYLLPNLIPKLRELAPRMPLVIEENYTRELAAQLRRSEIDVILVAEPFEEPGVNTWPLYDEQFVVGMPPDHPWAERDSIAPEELADENVLMLGPGHCFRDQILESCPRCAQVGEEAEQPFSGTSLETIRHMVASGLGITVLPQSSINPTRQDDLLVARPFSGRVPQRRILMAWRNSFTRPQAIEAVREAILHCSMVGVSCLLDTPIRS